tara:strand:+ start:292 stop:405 length:114 start_codon:yes stop_codon:yes gene_type:complete
MHGLRFICELSTKIIVLAPLIKVSIPTVESPATITDK